MGKTIALFKSFFETLTFLNFDKPNLGSNRTIVCLSSMLLGHCGPGVGRKEKFLGKRKVTFPFRERWGKEKSKNSKLMRKVRKEKSNILEREKWKAYFSISREKWERWKKYNHAKIRTQNPWHMISLLIRSIPSESNTYFIQKL